MYLFLVKGFKLSHDLFLRLNLNLTVLGLVRVVVNFILQDFFFSIQMLYFIVQLIFIVVSVFFISFSLCVGSLKHTQVLHLHVLLWR
jgi:hypothetical protein